MSQNKNTRKEIRIASEIGKWVTTRKFRRVRLCEEQQRKRGDSSQCRTLMELNEFRNGRYVRNKSDASLNSDKGNKKLNVISLIFTGCISASFITIRPLSINITGNV